MNYNHHYHAGNFADVFKHLVLVSLLSSLRNKETPFCVLDTHAGSGEYDLQSEAAKKTQEAEEGILKVLCQKNPPLLVKQYLDCLQIKKAQLRYYPGSPLIIRSFLRPQDRLIATELHPQAYRELKNTLGADRQATAHAMDGYQALKAYLPPKERRGCVLIDPPYEDPQEFEQLITALPLALKRWETGIYAIWYPIKDRPPIDSFHRRLKEKISRPMLVVELSLYPED
ncbi:MAG TPA: 23S rRNA (adenine(2030)-N(6))-methyltransferase RlmJ, partial [Gammaproteobacteria bacterium]|nr:23S rRNA (adenine(2030)-N(6))-methyltransferase RlmJ [Gammaproteobacteria bacterium]